MSQLSLDWPPRTHAGDPPSSHPAEARLRSSGNLSARQQAVFDVVVAVPGLWASQIAERIGESPTAAIFPENPFKREPEVRKRLSDLCGWRSNLLRHHWTPGEPESRWFHVEAKT